MKQFTTFVLFMQLVLCCSCRNYSNERTLDSSVLNDSIQEAAARGEAWSGTPELISKHLFPTRVQGEGNRSYAVQVENESNTACVVSVVDEGAMEGGLSGQRWKARFEREESGWRLTKLTHASR